MALHVGNGYGILSELAVQAWFKGISMGSVAQQRMKEEFDA